MDFSQYYIILDKSVIIGGQHVDETDQNTQNETGETTEGTEASVQAPADGQSSDAGQASSGGLFGNGMAFWAIVIVVYLGVLYYFTIRPNKKKEKEMKEMQASLKVGDTVMTSTGFYGKIVDNGEDVFIVEFGTNKGVRIPVSKTEVFAAKEPKMTPVKSSDSDK